MRRQLLDALSHQRPLYIDSHSGGLHHAQIRLNSQGVEYIESLHEVNPTNDMTDEQKRRILAICEDAIQKNHKVRVGWAIEQVLGQNYKPQLHKVVALALYETNKYSYHVHDKRPNDYEVIKNPNFKAPTWAELHPIKDRFRTGAITALFSLIVGAILWLLANQKQVQENTQLHKRIDTLKTKVDSLTKR